MTPDEFVAKFIEGWALPQPDAWIDYFRALSHPEVVATQPMLPTATGIDAYMRSFRNTFALMQDASVEVLRYAVDGDHVYIESILSATIGGRRMSIEVVDHFELKDNLIYRRKAYLDPAPIVIAILLRPRVLPAAIRCMRG